MLSFIGLVKGVAIFGMLVWPTFILIFRVGHLSTTLTLYITHIHALIILLKCNWCSRNQLWWILRCLRSLRVILAKGNKGLFIKRLKPVPLQPVDLLWLHTNLIAISSLMSQHLISSVHNGNRSLIIIGGHLIDIMRGTPLHRTFRILENLLGCYATADVSSQHLLP